MNNLEEYLEKERIFNENMKKYIKKENKKTKDDIKSTINDMKAICMMGLVPKKFCDNQIADLRTLIK